MKLLLTLRTPCHFQYRRCKGISNKRPMMGVNESSSTARARSIGAVTVPIGAETLSLTHFHRGRNRKGAFTGCRFTNQGSVSYIRNQLYGSLIIILIKKSHIGVASEKDGILIFPYRLKEGLVVASWWSRAQTKKVRH